MTDPQERNRALAQELIEAERSRQPVEHFSKRLSGMTIADSYAIQREWTALKLAGGDTIVGRKIGLTSKTLAPLTSRKPVPDSTADSPRMPRRPSRSAPCSSAADSTRPSRASGHSAFLAPSIIKKCPRPSWILSPASPANHHPPPA